MVFIPKAVALKPMILLCDSESFSLTHSFQKEEDEKVTLQRTSKKRKQVINDNDNG